MEVSIQFGRLNWNAIHKDEKNTHIFRWKRILPPECKVVFVLHQVRVLLTLEENFKWLHYRRWSMAFIFHDLH